AVEDLVSAGSSPEHGKIKILVFYRRVKGHTVSRQSRAGKLAVRTPDALVNDAIAIDIPYSFGIGFIFSGMLEDVKGSYWLPFNQEGAGTPWHIISVQWHSVYASAKVQHLIVQKGCIPRQGKGKIFGTEQLIA